MEPVKELLKKEKSVDLLLMMDCTGSMDEWIEEASQNLIKIIDSVENKTSEECKIRCGYIGYRDFGDFGQTEEHFDIIKFTENIQEVKDMIKSSEAIGGGD